MQRITLVIGASLNPLRHSYRTVSYLRSEGYPVAAIGPREGEIDGIQVQTGLPGLKRVHTVSLYLKPERQEPYIDYILSLHPRRIIFNKKTFNKALADKALAEGIAVMEDCTLVMIAKGTYWGD